MARILVGGSYKVNSFELIVYWGVYLGSQGTPFELYVFG